MTSDASDPSLARFDRGVEGFEATCNASRLGRASRGAASFLLTCVLENKLTTRMDVMNEDERILATDEESRILMERIFLEGIKPHAPAIAKIALRGDIAVVVFEVEEELKEALRNLGWRGEAVFALNREHAERMAAAAKCDAVTAAWLRRHVKNEARIFLWVHYGTLLVNYLPGTGFSFEAGSTDREVLN